MSDNHLALYGPPAYGRTSRLSISWAIISFFQNYLQIILRMLYAYKVNVLALQCPKFKYSISLNWRKVWKCKSTKKISRWLFRTILKDPWDKRTWLGFIKPRLKEQFFKSWHLQLIFNNFTFLFSVTCVCEGFWAMPAWVKTFFRIHSAYQIG